MHLASHHTSNGNTVKTQIIQAQSMFHKLSAKTQDDWLTLNLTTWRLNP
jgi:hypothetical protein